MLSLEKISKNVIAEINTRELARLIVEIRFEKIPEQVIMQGKHLIIYSGRS